MRALRTDTAPDAQRRTRRREPSPFALAELLKVAFCFAVLACIIGQALR